MIDTREFEQGLGLEVQDSRELGDLHNARVVGTSPEVLSAVSHINQEDMDNRAATNAFRDGIGSTGVDRYAVIEVRDPEAHKDLLEIDEEARQDMQAYEQLNHAEVISVVAIDDDVRGAAHLALVREESGAVRAKVFEEPKFDSVE